MRVCMHACMRVCVCNPQLSDYRSDSYSTEPPGLAKTLCVCVRGDIPGKGRGVELVILPNLHPRFK